MKKGRRQNILKYKALHKLNCNRFPKQWIHCKIATFTRSKCSSLLQKLQSKCNLRALFYLWVMKVQLFLPLIRLLIQYLIHRRGQAVNKYIYLILVTILVSSILSLELFIQVLTGKQYNTSPYCLPMFLSVSAPSHIGLSTLIL